MFMPNLALEGNKDGAIMATNTGANANNTFRGDKTISWF